MLSSSIPAIKAHLNIIEATHILVAQYHLTLDNYSRIMPIQIRLHEDRVKLFKPLLESNPDLYAKKSVLLDLKAKLLGVEKDNSRSTALVGIYMANAALRCQNDDVAYYLCLESLSILARSPDLVPDILPEVIDLLPNIGIDSKDVIGNLGLLAKALLVSKSSHFNSLVELWRNSLLKASLRYASAAIKSADVEEAYYLIEEKRFVDFADISSIAADSERIHDFYKPLGSSVGAGYFQKSIFQGQPCVLESNLDCLKLQNSLQAEGLPIKVKNDHSIAIAKGLYSIDVVLSIAYLLNCNYVWDWLT